MPGVRFDARKLPWVFRAAPVVEVTCTWHISPTRRIAASADPDGNRRDAGIESPGALKAA